LFESKKREAVRRKKAHRLFKDELFRKTINYLWIKEAQEGTSSGAEPGEGNLTQDTSNLPTEQQQSDLGATSSAPRSEITSLQTFPSTQAVQMEAEQAQQQEAERPYAQEGQTIEELAEVIYAPSEQEGQPMWEYEEPTVATPEPAAPETTVPEMPQEQIGHDVVRRLEDTLGSLEQMVTRAARLERLLADREYDTIMREFPDYGNAFAFFYRNDLLKYDPAKVHMIMLDPSMQNEAKKSMQTLLRYHFVMKAIREARARGLTDLGSLPRDTIVRMMSSEFDDLYAKAFGDKPLTDNDYLLILRSLQSAGFRVSGLPVQRTIAAPVTTSQPAAATSGGLKAFISSLGPLSLVSLLVGVPLGIAGLVQLLFGKEDSGIGPYLTTGAGALLSALGLMNVDRMVGLTR
jgi:hypothetical protein